jgi:hypothetical protein
MATRPEVQMTHHVEQMLEAHPSGAAVDGDALTACIDACLQCVQICTACADACLSEEPVRELVRCIRLDLDCADICETTGKVLTRQSSWDAGMAGAALQACAEACRICAEECERHSAHMDHCRICAEACRRCEAACNRLVSALAA